jgi:urease accessory protein
MFDSASRSDAIMNPAGVVSATVRGDSEISASFHGEDGRTHLARLFERGALRMRFPRTSGRREAVVVNTGGGITGGDRLSIRLDLDGEAGLAFTSQAAEKIYRSDGPAAEIRMSVRLDGNARLDWLPQETIVFDGAVAHRDLTVEMAATSRLTLFEGLGLGRVAHGETLRNIGWRDRWRIRRDGRLLLAEDIRIDGDAAALMQRPALGSGARAVGTMVHVAPDAEVRLAAVRAALEGAHVHAHADTISGTSAWNGMLIVRIAAPDLRFVRALAAAAICAVTDGPMPRAWSC